MDKEVEKEIKDAENYIKLGERKNKLSKYSFIEEIVNGGLGEEIKESIFIPSPEIKKESKIKRFFKKLLKKF